MNAYTPGGIYHHKANQFSVSQPTGIYKASRPDLSRITEELIASWKLDVCLLSNPDLAFESKYFSRIISLGYSAIPFILNDLRSDPSALVAALQRITGQDPVRKKHYGNVAAMVTDWDNWWRQENDANEK